MKPRVTFDSAADAVAIVFADAPAVKTVEAEDGRLVDFDAADNVVAIEVLGASGGFTLDDLVERYGLKDELAEIERYLPQQFYRHYA